MGQRQDKEEIARVMQQLRKEEKVAEEAQMAEVLAKGLPACLRELGGKTSDERRATFEASFAAVAREDEDRRAPRPAAPPTETAATDWTADDLFFFGKHFLTMEQPITAHGLPIGQPVRTT